MDDDLLVNMVSYFCNRTLASEHCPVIPSVKSDCTVHTYALQAQLFVWLFLQTSITFE